MAPPPAAVTSVSSRPTLRPFTPSRERPEALAERTVGRDQVLDSIHRRLMSAASSKNRNHTLLVGARGSGKTHVVEVALHRLRAEPLFAEKVAVARVDEDAVGIVTYADLLVALLTSLRPPTEVLGRARAGRDPAAIEAAIREHLSGRLLLAVVENLARVFEGLGVPGQRDLRSFVEGTGQVVLLATSPLLFEAVKDRGEPWFGSFAIEHLDGLTLAEGSELLRRIAAEHSDERLVRFLQGARGNARLAALHHLAGGLPRLWMILAGCATVESLDDLVPVVEELLEKLAPYYQQRLWELPGNEAKLVRELATGHQSAPVADIAAACGLDERTAATALGRLADGGWVRGQKLTGTDQRKTWYRLREPLLRHHFQYRSTDGEALRLIVDVLRTWFGPDERWTYLADARPASEAERYLLASLRLDAPPRPNVAWVERDPDGLLAEARRWLAAEPDALGTPDAGLLLEVAVIAVCTSRDAARRALVDRDGSPSIRARADKLLELVDNEIPQSPPEARIGLVLNAAAAGSAGEPDYRVLELVAACWNGHADRALAIHRLTALDEPQSDNDRLTQTIRCKLAYWLDHEGRHSEAVELLRAAVDGRARLLGFRHSETRWARFNLGWSLVNAGSFDEAVEILTTVVDDFAALETEYLCTLIARGLLTFALVGAGRVEEAFTAHELVEKRGSASADEVEYTLMARQGLALALVQFGHDEDACRAFRALAEDFARHFGADHPDSLKVLWGLARAQARLGREDEAIDLASALSQAGDGQSSGNDKESRQALDVVTVLLVTLLKSGKPLPHPERLGRFASTQIYEVFRDMEAARDGSSEAAARLPFELRSLVGPG